MRSWFVEDGQSVGRPLKEIDAETVQYLASIGCTQAEIAGYFGVASHSTISERFRQEYELGQSMSKITLRKRQWNASKRSVPMMIHLGKHMLGQTEKSDATEADDLIDELRQEREAGQQGMAQEQTEGDVQ